MRESCTSGSVRGASSDRRLYSTLPSVRRELVSTNFGDHPFLRIEILVQIRVDKRSAC